MSELKDNFKKAFQDINTLTERPDNETLLKLYGFYKQATEGDVSGEKPGFMDFKAVAKYNAWEEVKGTSKESAMQRYIDLVKSLL